jgi:hypothetical protein
MASKPTGRPRGRPRKPTSEERSSRGRGRPPIPISRDRDRYAVALIDAFTAMELGSSGRQRALAVASLQIGKERKQGPPDSHPGLWTYWEKIASPGMPATWDGYASTLREKRRKFTDLSSYVWRRHMARAFTTTLTQARRPGVKEAVLRDASTVGEDAFAQSVLWRMIDAA